MRDGLVELCCYLKDRYGHLEVMYEIGSYSGESAGIFSDYFEEVHCVDPWEAGMTEGGPDQELEFDRAAALNPKLHKHRAYSAAFASAVPDGSIDFAYIDGNHSLDFVRDDVRLWWPKVKLALAGHDWNMSHADPALPNAPDVNRAVWEFFHSMPCWGTVRLFIDTSWLVERRAGQ